MAVFVACQKAALKDAVLTGISIIISSQGKGLKLCINTWESKILKSCKNSLKKDASLKMNLRKYMNPSIY